ncbi:hypothetical protein AHAS_Ahas07G0170400 [Arachis hypogaea]
MVFDPTANMDLTYNECHIATYVYAKTDDLDEVLFKFYELEVVRGIFHSLIPKFVPRSDIVNIVVVFASQRALRDTPIRFWFLPSPFAVDVIQDNSDVWCLYWLLNDGLLDHRRLSVMMSENVRMKTATSIILSYWNQKKRVVDQEAEKLWRTLMRAHD